MKITIKNAIIILKKYLEKTDKSRFEHSIRVAQTSEILAKKWNAPIEDAIIAGLLHDIGKALNKNEILSLCVRNGVTIYDFEILENIEALHGKVSALLFENEFDKDDTERFTTISHAISSHVTGDDTMSLLDKIIFIADNVEPERFNNLLLRVQSNEIDSPNECIQIIINDKIERAKKRKQEHNPLLNNTLDSIGER